MDGYGMIRKPFGTLYDAFLHDLPDELRQEKVQNDERIKREMERSIGHFVRTATPKQLEQMKKLCTEIQSCLAKSSVVR